MTPHTPAVNAAGELLPEQPKSVYPASGDLTGSYTGAAHTPGPWQLDPPSYAHVVSDDYHAIQGGIGYFPGVNSEERGFGIMGCISLADARLMTAAPDMLKTLSDMDGWLANTGHGEDHPWRISIRAAIAKAAGIRALEAPSSADQQISPESSAALATQGVQLAGGQE